MPGGSGLSSRAPGPPAWTASSSNGLIRDREPGRYRVARFGQLALEQCGNYPNGAAGVKSKY